MLIQLNCVIVDSDAANREELAAFLGARGVNTAAQLIGIEQLPAVLTRADAPQLVIANLDPNPGDTLDRLALLMRQFPTVSLFCISGTLDPNLLIRAMHLGVKEFIPLPIQEDRLADAIERVAGMNGVGRRAKLIQVIPTIGGCGSTTVACNIAASLSKLGKTVLIDLDLPRGACASSFDLRPRYTIADVMDSQERLDSQLLENALAVHPASKLAVLARPELPEDTQRVNEAGIERLLNTLGRMFDFVVIDSMMSIDPIYARAIREADQNVFVMQFNVPSAKNTERFIGALRRMGIEPDKLRIVVNRYVKKGWDIPPEDVEKMLGLEISWLIPNDFKNAITAINFGEPLVLRVPKAEISVSLTGLAQLIAGRARAPGAVAA